MYTFADSPSTLVVGRLRMTVYIAIKADNDNLRKKFQHQQHELMNIN